MSTFTDEAVAFVRAGRGGDGSASFHREKYRPRGGPDGGNGGHGGDVVLEVSDEVYDLSFLARNPHHRAEDGEPGQGNSRHGRRGDDLVIPVPDGTLVREERGTVADLVGRGMRVVVARGGRGGRGNASLASSTNRAPRVADRGESGEEHRLELELRLVADVALVGLPNAGKSTLLSRMTAARPKIAPYPFTTLTPNLGVAGGDDWRYVVADVPGLVEGAHEGKGLGVRFLRHLSRCRVLAEVVDLSSDDPAKDLAVLREELGGYDAALLERPRIIVATKRDLVPDAAAVEHVEHLQAFGETVVVSGLTGEGVDTLAARLKELAEASAEAALPYVVLRPGREPFVVRRQGERFRVEGRLVERWVAETDFDDPAAVLRLQKRLRKHGVESSLSAAGARRGDEVLIGDRPFEFIPEDR